VSAAAPHRLLHLTLLSLVLLAAFSSYAQPPLSLKSGALIGLSSEETLRIAPIDGTIQVLAADGYTVPGKMAPGMRKTRLRFMSTNMNRWQPANSPSKRTSTT
jgi:hypothetical protein